MASDYKTLSNALLKYLKTLKRKKIRDSENKFIIEGVRLCQEAIDSNARLSLAIVSEEKWTYEPFHQMMADLQGQDAPVYIASQSQFKSLADTDNPQGIACVAEKSLFSVGDFWKNMSPLILGVDKIRDPGNLGTIIRTADWFGIQTVLMNTGTVDVYNPKVVRSTMGSIFRLNLIHDIDWENLLPEMKEHGYQVIALESEGGIPLKEAKRSEKDLVLIGGEATGFSDSLKSFYDLKVTIPRLGHGESLNAAIASGIFLSHFTS